jgi:hypothetical protein
MARKARMKRIPREMGLLEAAGRGAVAGLVGGVAMTLLDRTLMERLGGRDQRVREWDRQVARGARRAGVRLTGGRRTAAGIATTLAYGAAIGAVYGMARSRTRDVEAAAGILDTGLVYAATLVGGAPATRTKQGRGRPPQAMGLRGAAQRVSAPAVFGRATTTAFRMLTR